MGVGVIQTPNGVAAGLFRQTVIDAPAECAAVIILPSKEAADYVRETWARADFCFTKGSKE